MHAPNKAESFTGWIPAGQVFFLAFTCIPSFLLPPSRRMVHAPASPSASLSVPISPKIVLTIDQVQQRGHVTWVTYFKREHLTPSSHLDTRIRFSRHGCSLPDFQQLRAEHALEAAPELEYRIQANIPEHQLQPSSKALFISAEESAWEMPVGYRISLPTKSDHIVPKAERLYRVTKVFERNEHCVEAEIFESYMKGTDSVQGLKKKVYTLSTFKAKFEHTPQYEKEYKKAMALRGFQDSTEEYQGECQEKLENKGWFGACLSFF